MKVQCFRRGHNNVAQEDAVKVVMCRVLCLLGLVSSVGFDE